MYKNIIIYSSKKFIKNLKYHEHCNRDICLCIYNLNLDNTRNLIYYKRCFNNSFIKDKLKYNSDYE